MIFSWTFHPQERPDTTLLTVTRLCFSQQRRGINIAERGCSFNFWSKFSLMSSYTEPSRNLSSHNSSNVIVDRWRWGPFRLETLIYCTAETIVPQIKVCSLKFPLRSTTITTTMQWLGGARLLKVRLPFGHACCSYELSLRVQFTVSIFMYVYYSSDRNERE